MTTARIQTDIFYSCLQGFLNARDVFAIHINIILSSPHVYFKFIYKILKFTKQNNKNVFRNSNTFKVIEAKKNYKTN